ncbi:MAG: carbohydrate-binding protein, partial [Kibdelosporangium sp.]
TSTEANPTHTYSAKGAYNVQLEVTDETGKTGVANVSVSVGNTAPTVSVASPVDGGFFDFGNKIPFDVKVTDPEDGAIDCTKVIVQPALGHDAHAHPGEQINACQGLFTTVLDSGHADANIFYSVDANYTDRGADGVPPLVGRDVAVLQPKHKQAEYFTNSSGIRIVSQAGAESGRRIGDINGGDWISFTPVNLTGIEQVALRVSAPAGAGGSVELRSGSPTGALVATVTVPSTGGWDNYELLPPVAVADPGGTNELFMVFRGGSSPFDLDSMTFIGDGVADRKAPVTAPTLAPAAPDGSGGWYTSNPVVSLGANDGQGSGVASTEYSVDSGAWQPYTQPFAVPGDGTHVVKYRSTDRAGNVETDGSVTVKVDTTAPAVQVTGVRNGSSYGDSIDITPAWQATDAGSGVASTTAALDGKPLAVGATVPLHTLTLGAHELVVTAVDAAGKSAAQRVGFTVVTSPGEIRTLVTRFVPDKTAVLTPPLDLADRLDRAGQPHAAALTMSVFVFLVKFTVRDKAVAALLVRDADALIQQWRR